MPRCALPSSARTTRVSPTHRRRAIAMLSGATVAALALAFAAPAHAQMARLFPQNALRGIVAFQAPPAVKVNGQPAQLAPGARIHGLDNMLKLSGTLAGTQFLANYTIERTSGLVYEVWLLRDDEAANQPWPVSADQTAAWTFNPSTQTWTRP